MINFLGIGSAFNTKLGNTSGFIKDKDSIVLIDCGCFVFHKLMKLNLLHNIKKINILITHTHSDHVGSLGDLISYAYYILKLKPNIYYPNEKWLKEFLIYLGIKDELYAIYNKKAFNIKLGQNNDELMSVNFSPVEHTTSMDSYGMIIERNKEKVYYSGDAAKIPQDILERFKAGDINELYQDTCFNEYEGIEHLTLKKLSELIPQNLRKKVFCTHLDQFIDINEIKNIGFSIPKIYDQG